MKFADIPCHESTKERLRALVDNDRLPHAILLQGRAGIGKFLLARAMAQYVHCENRQNGDSCGVCPSCVQHRSLNHIDTLYSFPVIKFSGKSTVPVSDDYLQQWREFLDESPYMNFDSWVSILGNENARPVMYVDESVSLIRKLNFTSHGSKYKIVVMWLPERMNEECANKLLKLIEEPPKDTLFIFTSDRPAEILPTIYSRLQRIDVSPMTEEAVASILSSEMTHEEAVAAAHLSSGSVTEGMSRASVSSEENDMFDMFTQLMRLAYQRRIIDLRSWAEKLSKSGREKSMKFLTYCERLTGENFIYNLNNPGLVYMTRPESDFSRNFARFITEKNVEKLRKVFIEARTDIAGNANSRIVLFDVAVKVILLLKP